MADSQAFLVILGMVLVTQIPRILPFAVLSGRNLSVRTVTWLSYVPASVVSAMLATQIFVTEGKIHFGVTNPLLLASIPCLAAGLLTRNTFITVVAGIVSLALVRM